MRWQWAAAVLVFIYSGLGLGVKWVAMDGAGRGRVDFVMVLSNVNTEYGGIIEHGTVLRPGIAYSCPVKSQKKACLPGTMVLARWLHIGVPIL